jgi:hypothetical protein
MVEERNPQVPATQLERDALGRHLRHPDPHPQYALQTEVDAIAQLSTSDQLPTAETVDDPGAVGTSTDAARADHVHPMPGLATTLNDGFMSAADKIALAGLTAPVYTESTTIGYPMMEGEDGAAAPIIPGQPGRDGAQGLPGVPGRDGEDGQDGLPGRDGIRGEIGPIGIPGRDGEDGEDAPIIPGRTGDTGATGATGATGPASATVVIPGADGEDGDASVGLVNTPLPGEFYQHLLNLPTLSITGTATATLNRMHVVTGTSADYTITISGLSPRTGDVLGFQVSAYTASSKVYKLDAGGTVKIAGRTRYLSLVHTNVVLLRWDGTDWQPLVMCLDSPWIHMGDNTITAVTTDPTPGGTVQQGIAWRRTGHTMEVQSFFEQRTSAGTAGSGTYLWLIPMGVTVDTAIVYTGAFTSASTMASCLGTGNYIAYGSGGQGIGPIAYDTTHLAMYLQASANVMGSAVQPMSSTNWSVNFLASFPVTDW